MSTPAPVPRCLTVAASDSGGGAGLQADLRAFAALGCHGTSAVTGVTAQNTRGVVSIHPLPARVVVEQIRAVLDDIGADAVKTGALLSAATTRAVAEEVDGLACPLVVDPVMAASAGGRRLDGGAPPTTLWRLLRRATVVTPNLAEARSLAGRGGSRRDLAEALVERGARAVLVTGGHGEPVDHLFDGSRHVEIAVPRLASGATHGTGCTHSALLAAGLARGYSLEAAARTAAALTAAAVARGLRGVGSGEGPVDVLDLGRRGAQVSSDIQRRRTR